MPNTGMMNFSTVRLRTGVRLRNFRPYFKTSIQNLVAYCTFHINYYFFFLAIPGLELTAYTLSYSTSPCVCVCVCVCVFVLGILEIGSLELFAWVSFKL
jgi:hypothetical protein